MGGGASRGETCRPPAGLGAGAKARNAELVRELARAVGNCLSHLFGLEQDRLAALRQDLADQPFDASDRHLRKSGAVLQRHRAALSSPAGRDALEVQNLGRTPVPETVRVERAARLEAFLSQLGAAHPVEAEAPLGVARAVPRVHAPVRQLPLERVRLDDSLRPRLFALLLVLDLDESTLADAFGEGRDEVGFRFYDLRIGRLRELELSESLLELLAHPVERRVRLGGGYPAHQLQCEPDRSRLERRQARREAERVAVQLLVDVHAVALERGVDRVTAAAEVDEVQQLQMLFELFLRNVEA